MDSDLFFGLKKNKKEDKNQFLKTQRQAREQREQAKREQNSALKIQSLYRSAKIREKNFQELVADRYKKLSDVQKLKDKLSPQQFALIANKIFMYKGFLSFVIFLKPSNAKDYQSLVLTLSEFLLHSLETEDALFLNILNKNKEIRVSWYIKLKHILNALLQNAFVYHKGEIDGMNDGSKERSIAEKLLQKLMKMNTQVWPTLGNALAKNKELDLSYSKEIKQKLTNSISSQVLQNVVFSREFKQSTFLRKLLLKVIANKQDIADQEMFLELLCLESFYKDLQSMKPEKRQQLVSFLISQIGKGSSQKPKNIKFTERFIREFVEFLHFTLTNRLLQGFEAKFFQNIFDVLTAYIQAYNSAMLSLNENKKILQNTMEVEEEKEQSAKSPTKSKGDDIKIVIYRDPSMALSIESTGIKHLCEVISEIFGMFTSTDFETFSTIVAKGCETLMFFKRSLKSYDKNLLKNHLSFKLNFYYLPFMCIKRQGYNVKSILLTPEKYVPIIKVFSEVLYQTLRITDDEEFLNNSEIVQSSWLLISPEDIIDIGGFCNHLLYNIIWNHETSYYPIIESQVKLVRELYNRDSRLKFCPKKFWTIPELEAMTQTLLSGPGYSKLEAMENILEKVPHMLPFELRLRIMHKLIESDKLQHDRFPVSFGNGPQDQKVITIRRQYLLEDAFEKISQRKDMRSLFMIKFINEHDMVEEGVDGGGLLKEFITLIGKIAFDVNYGLFIENEDKTLMPNPNSHIHPEHLKLFNFLGRLTGKSIYEHILLESVFSVIFLNRILKIPNTINELKFADPTLYKNLMLLKHKNDVADQLCLTFSVNETVMGQTRTHLLKPNGDNIDVNESNKLEYISLFCDYKLNQAIKEQSYAFLHGLQSTVDLSWVKLFNHEELQYVISGMRKKGFSVEDLKANVHLRGFDGDSSTIQYLWEVLEEMSDDDKSLFLLFITGCSRPPTLGFKFMDPQIAINNSSHDPSDVDKLPSAATCANLFKLPNYRVKELLRQKLLYAIHAQAGFDMA